MFVKKFLISVLVIGCCAIPASAAMVGYCSASTPCVPSAGFAAATAGDTFQNITVSAGSLGTNFLDASGADFSDPAGLTGVLSLAGWPAGGAIVAGTGINSITITLPTAVNAVEFYAGAQDYSNFTITVDDGSGPYANGYLTGTPTSGAFFGITTTASFTSFTITGQSTIDKLTLDDISIGSAGSSDVSPTPEAATLLLVGTGLFMMGYLRRRMPRRIGLQAASRGTVSTMSTAITPA
jgi:hypothetical protein